ncbi:diaminopimelate epimerase [Dichotomicrobium thermohalophilum]|uniref:Diaminopimelate epimerase n=1 Tax=Dichotomicrobium thermohalophilum TaxID=933063 RepID=A0A397Q446_9HYPH|nr:diaminopimelate epimerase [Dichotomicrobium thermohalophilum]RIA56290.1 diaminopimelate epimerase [Dichotomicrobium thermohalophilum]
MSNVLRAPAGDHLRYWKMNGLGNDFVIADTRSTSFRVDGALARALSDRDEGIGCDQVAALEPSDRADLFMRIFNADGSEVGACGNVSRCVAVLLADENGLEHCMIETASGVIAATATSTDTASVDMGAPKFGWIDIPLAHPVDDTSEVFIGPAGAGAAEDDVFDLGLASVVNVGNPHCVFWVDDAEAIDLARIGPALEQHPLFPERVNVSMAQVNGPDSITLRVWERGAGLTRACGTAACAVTVAAARTGRAKRHLTVNLPGGPLDIHWRASDDHIIMTGPVEWEHRGEIDISPMGALTGFREVA